MKAVVAAFNQEKALVGAFSLITNLRMELFEALFLTLSVNCPSRISQGDHLELAFNEFLILAELVSVHKFGLRHRPAPFT